MVRPPKTHAVRELALFFLRLGTTAFGGPAVHIAIMEEELVRRRRWLSHGRFLDLLAAANLIPGPSSTELAIHIGYQRAGWLGLVLGGSCFLLPAAVMVCILAWLYKTYGHVPAVAGVLYGVKPVVVAVVLQAVWNLGRAAVKGPLQGAVALATLALALVGVSPLALLVGSGALVAALNWRAAQRGAGLVPLLALLGGVGALVAISAGLSRYAVASARPGALALLVAFLKVGSVVYGSGYVLLAFLQRDLVEHAHWLSPAQLLDAVAVGQVTPGPLFTTATFIGYLLGGLQGAVAATVGVFLPAFLLVAATGPFIFRLRRAPLASAFLDGVVAASLGLMAAVTMQLAAAAIVGWVTALLAMVSAFLLLRWKVNSAWIVLGGAAVGLLLSLGR